MYNANKLAKLVKKKKGLKNWLDYCLNQYARNPNKRPTTKVCLVIWQTFMLTFLLYRFFSIFFLCIYVIVSKQLTFFITWLFFNPTNHLILTQTGFLGLWGQTVDSIDFYKAEIEKLSKEVRAIFILQFPYVISLLSNQRKKKGKHVSCFIFLYLIDFQGGFLKPRL